MAVVQLTNISGDPATGLDRLILCEGHATQDQTSLYLILYEHPFSIEDTQILLTRHGIGATQCDLEDIYEFYNSVNVDSRTLFICHSSEKLESPKILSCINIQKFQLVESLDAQKSTIHIETLKRKFEFTFNDPLEASRWIKAYFEPSTNPYCDSEPEERLSNIPDGQLDESIADSLAEVKPKIKRKCLRLVRQIIRRWSRLRKSIKNKPRRISLDLPFSRESKNNFVYPPRLPMLLHWNHHLIVLTEHNDLWCLDFTSQSDPLWTKSWPTAPPTTLSCIAINNNTMYALGTNEKIYIVSLGSTEEKNIVEWREVRVDSEIPKRLRILHGQSDAIFGMTEEGIAWKFTLDNPYGNLSAQEFKNGRFSGIVSNFMPSEIGAGRLLVYDSNSNVFSLDFQTGRSRKILRGNVEMGQLTQLILHFAGRPIIFNVQESDHGTTQIHLNHLSMFRWNTLDLSLDHLLTHTTLIQTQNGWRLFAVDSFNTVYTKDIENLEENPPWVENWLIPLPEKASYRNSDQGWEKIPTSLKGGFRDLSVSGDGAVWGLAQDMSVWSLGVEGDGWWKPIDGEFTCISVGMKNNIWVVDTEGDVFYRLRDNVWAKDSESRGFKCVNVGSDGVVWGLDLTGHLWQRAENGWKQPTAEDLDDDSEDAEARK
ncbi:hypothetical protein K7432_016115, partial [Basidiobolus ranarum]